MSAGHQCCDRGLPVLARAVASGLVAVLIAAGLVGGSREAIAGRAQVGVERYQPPTDADVIDPFRPPDQPWLPGNRGLEYETEPGSSVWAIGPGLVVFAGQVGGQLHVTILHADGIRSSYSFLASISVSRGDRVEGGHIVGSTAATFHLGARVGSVYIDPAGLFGTPIGSASVYLVPSDRPARARPGHAGVPAEPGRDPALPAGRGPRTPDEPDHRAGNLGSLASRTLTASVERVSEVIA